MSRALLIAACLFAVPVIWAGPVDINTADVETLARELDGIGLRLAERIVADRERNGPFRSPEDIMRVPYIGPRLYERNAQNIRVGPVEQQSG